MQMRRGAKAPKGGHRDAPSTTKLSSKGQLVIPREVREAMQWHQGDTLVIEMKGNDVILRRQSLLGPTLSVEEVSGMLKGMYKGAPLTKEEMDRKARDGLARDWKLRNKRHGRR
jgi:AbrB family looped-hinge helix DNA binding protein